MVVAGYNIPQIQRANFLGP